MLRCTMPVVVRRFASRPFVSAIVLLTVSIERTIPMDKDDQSLKVLLGLVVLALAAALILGVTIWFGSVP